MVVVLLLYHMKMKMYDVYVILLFCHLTVLHLSAGNANEHTSDCPDLFDCGSLGNISFPFTTSEHPNCGALAIQGCNNPNQTALKQVRLSSGGKLLQVTNIVGGWRWKISIIDKDYRNLLENSSCNALSYNITVPPSSPFGYFSLENNITALNCSHHKNLNLSKDFINYTRCSPFDFYFAPSSSDQNYLRSLTSSCSMVQLPVRQDSQFFKDPFGFLNPQITFQFQSSSACWRCRDRGGNCRLDSNAKLYCAMRKSGAWNRKLPLMLALTVVASVVVVLMVLICCFRAKIFYPLFWRENPTHRVIEDILKEHGPLPTARFSYLEVKKMTNSFRNKLGQGGFGSVYKGKLHDGCVVAVKVLTVSKGNGEEFINEVVSISRTSHVNIIRLLGFCFENTHRALVYEFMPNGSLDKFIYEDKIASKDVHQLDWKILNDIAAGIARGLEYLYRGCNTRIVHFDIKPHNILLDEDFCPKIADFGLAKVCPRKESMVSLFGARGTAGYIAPEVFSRNFGAVSHKSDVYSYGMMVLEMVGKRKNIKTKVDRSSEIYFPHWIYNRLESNTELGLENVRNESEDEMVRKMTIVGLWCIQTHPSTRPTISKVVEMLESKLDFLQIPPKPYLSSPPISPTKLSYESL